jgi:hypothetical protein
MKCFYCGSTEEELRPYGPNGTNTCYECATSTPERNAKAQAVFGTLLDAAAAVSPLNTVVIGKSSGPQPVLPEDLDE